MEICSAWVIIVHFFGGGYFDLHCIYDLSVPPWGHSRSEGWVVCAGCQWLLDTVYKYLLTLLDCMVSVFTNVRHAFHLCPKFEVSSFNRSLDIRGPKIPKVGHMTPTWPLWPNFAFFVDTHCRPFMCQIWVSSFIRSGDIRGGGSQNSKSGSRDPTWPHFT